MTEEAGRETTTEKTGTWSYWLSAVNGWCIYNWNKIPRLLASQRSPI